MQNKMINSLLVATNMLLRVNDENARQTEGYEGFYHLIGIQEM